MELTLDWPQDVDGYRIKTAPAGSGKTLAQTYEAYDVVVRNGGKLYTRPVVAPALYETLARCSTNSELLEFCNEYGLPRGTKSIPVETIYGMIEVVRSLLATTKNGDWLAIGKWLKDNPRVIEFSSALGYDEAGRPQLEFKPRSLIQFIYAQLIQDKSGGARYKRCLRPGCGKYFYYGSKTGKRKTALYCTDTCQKAHAYMKRKGEIK